MAKTNRPFSRAGLVSNDGKLRDLSKSNSPVSPKPVSSDVICPMDYATDSGFEKVDPDDGGVAPDGSAEAGAEGREEFSEKIEIILAS